MRALRIYKGNEVTDELQHLGHVTVSRSGALCVELDHTDRPGIMRGLIVAAGEWTRAEDWTGYDDPAPELSGEQLAEEVGPVLALALEQERREQQQSAPAAIDAPTDPRMTLPRPAAILPGGVQLPGESVGIVRDPLALSDGLRLRQALEVHCICTALRCPVLVRGGLPGGVVEPRQCDLLDMHDGEHDNQGRWIWGPHNHHPKCPRNPAEYNKHVGLCGALLEIESVPIVGTGCMLPFDHTGAHDYGHPDGAYDYSRDMGTGDGRAATTAGLTIPTQRERSSAAHALRAAGLSGAADALSAAPAPVWPAVHPGDRSPAAQPAAEPMIGLVLPRPLVDPALREHDSAAPTPAGWFADRTVGQECGDSDGNGSRCTRPAGHDIGPHAWIDPDGGLNQW